MARRGLQVASLAVESTFSCTSSGRRFDSVFISCKRYFLPLPIRPLIVFHASPLVHFLLKSALWKFSGKVRKGFHRLYIYMASLHLPVTQIEGFQHHRFNVSVHCINMVILNIQFEIVILLLWTWHSSCSALFHNIKSSFLPHALSHTFQNLSTTPLTQKRKKQEGLSFTYKIACTYFLTII